MPKIAHPSIYPWLDAAQQRSGKTWAQIAQEADVSYSYLMDCRSGYKSKKPSTPIAKRIATVVGFDWTLFFP
jgi:hypothetical protein